MIYIVMVNCGDENDIQFIYYSEEKAIAKAKELNTIKHFKSDTYYVEEWNIEDENHNARPLSKETS